MAGDDRTTIVFDIDGVLCEETGLPDDYARRKPLRAGIDLLKRLRAMGCRIVLHSARFRGDEPVTMAWLDAHGVSYDGLVLGKPRGDVYIDDRAIRFPLGGFERGMLDDIVESRRR